MSGALAGPAGPLAAAAAGATRLPRIWAAIAVAVALHAALLAVRPGGLTGSHVAPAAKAMAVRMVRPATPAEPTAGVGVERTPTTEPAVRPEPAVAAAAARIPAAAAERGAKPARETSTARAGGLAPSRNPAPSVAAPAAAAMPSTAETALPAAPDYAFGVRLDPGPRPLDEIDPDYPDPHLREGTVVLRLLISDRGVVDNVAVVRSDPPGVFDQAALDAFGKARFSPGMAAGTPVKSQITVEVSFVPINRGGRVSGRTY